MSQELMNALAKALTPYLTGAKASGNPASFSSGLYPYADGGLFGRCDGSSTVINAMVGPLGFEALLNWRGTNTQREIVDALTSVVESGSEQSTACGDCMTTSLKAAAQNYFFGRFCRQTEEMQFDNIGLKANSNIPVKNIFGDITDAMGNVLVPSGSELTDVFYIQSRLAGYFLSLKNATMLWTGNPVNNSGTTLEYKGLNLIINTGKFDVYTENSASALDSFLMNYANNAITSTGTYAIQNWFRRMILQFQTRASRAGMNWETATMYIVMHENLWEGVAKTFACTGMDLCTPNTSVGRVTISADQARDRYEEYLSRMALPINGRWYPVVTDSQITDTPGQANGVCSDIYFITTDINGQEILYGEYQDFDQTYGPVRNELSSLFGSDDIAITDGGRFALVRSNSRGCFDMQVVTKPRLVALMPWLSGRIQNVCNDVLEEPLPDVSGSGGIYEKDGGRTTIAPSLLYD